MPRREGQWDNVTDVKDARRLLDCERTSRELRFQYLVRCYLCQILHGCVSAYCTTPTCLSCSRRLVSRPFRPPTQLTARALAYYLASQPDPSHGLCPHKLRLDPTDLELELGGTSRATAGEIGSVAQRHQAKKDPKSLGQNIYDTVTVIYSYSKHIPRPYSMFASLRSTAPIAQTSAGETTDHANGQPSHPMKKHPSQSYCTPEPLSNGQHVHKFRHMPRKSLESSSLDGALEGTHLGMSDMRTKPPKTRLPPTPRHGFSSLNILESAQSARVHGTEEKSRRALPVVPYLTCDILDTLKQDVCQGRNKLSSDLDYFVEFDSTNRDFQLATPFVNRSLFYTLSKPATLLESFRDLSNPDYKESPLPHLDASRLTVAFGDWKQRNGALIFDSLWTAVEALFRPPPELDTQKSPRLKPSRKDAVRRTPETYKSPSDISTPYLSDEEAAHLVMICVHALTSLVSTSWPNSWPQVRNFRGWGVVLPSAPPGPDHANSFARFISIIDELEFEPAIRLADRLLRGIGTRMCFEHILASLKGRDVGAETSHSRQVSPLLSLLIEHLAVVERAAIAKKTKHKVNQNPAEDPGWTVTATFLEWLRTIIIKKFDGKAEVNKWDSVGAAIIVLDSLHANLPRLNLRKDMFSIPYLNEHVDTVAMPNAFLNWEERPNSVHLFQFPFLFKDAYLVAYFRAINFNRMFEQFEHAGRTKHLQRRFDILLDRSHWQMLNDRLRVTREDFLRVEVTREDLLKDTLDYLWGQERRMLLKPLKVIIGKEEGELGFDQGGVTSEFFRLVLGEAFKPDNGLFTIDSQTRMTWFHPVPLEPIWKYEMIGVLFSLAIYNGITLPVTFPLVFYTSLLGAHRPDYPYYREQDESAIDSIRDGWPMLAKSFDELLRFEGNVEDVFARDYVFSADAYGATLDYDMRTKKEAGEDVQPVTNENREQFVVDYIAWLTVTSVRSQFLAFRKGFLTCLEPKSLDFFTPRSLRSLIEGSPTISVTQLRKHTHYDDGYTPTTPTIVDFWTVVESYSQDKLKKLLEFVIASERVPVTGYESMGFSIYRAGNDTDRLPTSSTCFGRLYLPEYKGREKMREKLGIALQYSKGFGVV
ncbi:hypothetical protein P280DRAFT_468109 [Massarina eburnea CBS 473.64]|uniref:HECT-type E3 ubiquitin transferase n=1 Tax=Massarina eburnea CBS 473.64 TaxID=1395130 RepID=A0A6A6S6I7_9PLEO|nr:hypothetical protein P280DRAFT_468109 [Massarina eburnea CBS 473.64]